MSRIDRKIRELENTDELTPRQEALLAKRRTAEANLQARDDWARGLDEKH